MYFQALSRPIPNVCRVGKIFGGHMWSPSDASTDGLKYICMDKLYKSIKANECLVYTFGLADDWSFEVAMVELGCRVATT